MCLVNDSTFDRATPPDCTCACLDSDNVGGAVLEVALAAARNHARVVACGCISDYDTPESKRYGVRNLFNVSALRVIA
jgi:NADPH-dependent curcumin reductase CurA